MHCIPDVPAAQLILEGQQVDVDVAGALDLVRKLPPPDLLPLCVIGPPKLKGHGDASMHSFIQVMRPAFHSKLLKVILFIWLEGFCHNGGQLQDKERESKHNRGSGCAPLGGGGGGGETARGAVFAVCRKVQHSKAAAMAGRVSQWAKEMLYRGIGVQMSYSRSEPEDSTKEGCRAALRQLSNVLSGHREDCLQQWHHCYWQG